ncbi:MAG: phospholipase D-like domain-containing protein [Myxococcota bacterium]|nr:phospholipase D-like domain-containing protein [Myxococcota bacterium]
MTWLPGRGNAGAIGCVLTLLLSLSAAAEETTTAHLDRRAVAVTVEAIDDAQGSVDAVVYKFTEEALLAAVGRAVKRGVRVRLVVDESESRNRRSQAGLAEAAGAAVRRWEARRGKLHAKFVVVDGEEVLTGSYNWSRSAARSNLELRMSLRDPDVVKRFSQLFEALWDASPR